MNSAAKIVIANNESTSQTNVCDENCAASKQHTKKYYRPATVFYRPRYKVDIASQHAECELNYVRLCKVLVDLHARDNWAFEFGQETLASRLVVEVIERAPYTTTLTLRQAFAQPSEQVASPTITVRLYHDATMAEVIAWEDHRRLHHRYETPNKKMYHADEKKQLNQFLSDWLVLCQRQGRTTIDLASMGISSS